MKRIANNAMSVPLIDLKRDVATHRDEYLAIIARVIDSGIFASGHEVQTFEQAFAEYLGVKHAVGVANGTLALYAAYLALDIGPGDEVIVPANTFIATAEAVMMTGATPTFVDIDLQTKLLNISDLDRVVTEKTKAVAVVHLFGLVADVDAIKAWAEPKGIAIMEDAAQAHGAKLPDGRMAGTMGNVGCFSFYPTKNLGAMGEGGAVVTNDDAIAEVIRSIRVHGAGSHGNDHVRFGMNLRMDAIQGGILNARLVRLNNSIVRRREIAERYREAFTDIPLDLPPQASDQHVYHLYVVATNKRDELKAHLAEREIGSAVHYPIAVPDQPVFADRGVFGSCPVATREAGRILSLPFFLEITNEEIEEVIQGVRSFFLV